MADQSELDASMGRPSSFKTGTTGVAAAAKPAAPAAEAPAHEPGVVDGFVSHLKQLLGIGGDTGTRPGVEAAVNKAVAGVDPNKPGLDY